MRPGGAGTGTGITTSGGFSATGRSTTGCWNPARALPHLRDVIRRHLEIKGLTRQRILAAAVRLARASYIDPRLIELYEGGTTIASALENLGRDRDFGELATRGHAERAVLRLLARH